MGDADYSRPTQPYTALARLPRAKRFVTKSEIGTKPVLLYYLILSLWLAALYKAVWSNYKLHYIYQKLRSAYTSLKRNLNYLFVFEQHPDLNIPNATNLLDGAFADLKRHLACYHGMKKENKVKFIKDYFSVPNSK